MKEMNDWERRCVLRDQECVAGKRYFEEAAQLASAEYMDIFNRYCSTKKGIPRGLFYDNPPDYDPNGEAIVNIKPLSPELLEIQTQQHYSHRKRHIFRLALENGEWRLFEKQIITENGELLEASL